MDGIKNINGENKRKIVRAVSSFLVFFILWTCYILFKRKVEIPDFIPGILSLGDLIWIASGFFLIYTNRDRLYAAPKKMFTTMLDWKHFSVMLTAVAAYYIGVMLVSYGGIHVQPQDSLFRLLITFFIVGFQEELLFRGYLLNALAGAVSRRCANWLSAAMFLLIHVPGWLLRGYTFADLAGTGFGVLLLGLFFGYAFHKGKSLWGAVFLHMVWDVLARFV